MKYKSCFETSRIGLRQRPCHKGGVLCVLWGRTQGEWLNMHPDRDVKLTNTATYCFAGLQCKLRASGSLCKTLSGSETLKAALGEDSSAAGDTGSISSPSKGLGRWDTTDPRPLAPCAYHCLPRGRLNTWRRNLKPPQMAIITRTQGFLNPHPIHLKPCNSDGTWTHRPELEPGQNPTGAQTHF